MTYIYDRPGWPDFVWDSEALAGALAAARHRQGRHLGRMESLGFELRAEASLTALTDEVVKSSAIEGELLSPEEVRSSIACQLGLDAAGLPEPSRQVDGVVRMMLDATRHFDEPLTAQRLFDWHAALFPTGRSGMSRITVGAWRTGQAGPMRVVSGPIGREKVHFEAPEAERLEAEMAKFLEWFNRTSDIDPVLEAAVAHFWFVTIHPFEDGNGRIGRAIAEMLLSQADGTKDRFYSMSSGTEAQRREYYFQLESASAAASTSPLGSCGSSVASTGPSRMRTGRSGPCFTRRGSGNESTRPPSTSDSTGSSTACSTVLRVISRRRNTPSSPSARATRHCATSASCWGEASC